MKSTVGLAATAGRITRRAAHGMVALVAAISLVAAGGVSVALADEVPGEEFEVPEETPPPPPRRCPECPAPPEGPNIGRISFSGGNDFTTAYVFRGIMQERYGFITQPYAEMGINVYKGEGFLSDITLIGGVWNSVHGEATGQRASSLDSWYEADVYGGVNFGLFDDVLTLSSLYIMYGSPNDAFSAIQEVDFGAAIDDSEWLGMWALNPHTTFGVETENSALGPNQGTYCEVGIEPSFELIKSDTYPVTLSLPLNIGLSVNDYYELANPAGKINDDTYGYLGGGPVVSIPLAFIPNDYGSWSASGGVTFYDFGDNETRVNRGDGFWAVGTWGISMTY